MAGTGRAPSANSRGLAKNPDRRFTSIAITPAKQPTLLRVMGAENPATKEPWLPATKKFWRAIGSFPTFQNLVEAQWILLASSMIYADAMFSGDLRAGQELRLQLAKYGISPDDVARLRISFAVAEVTEKRAHRAAEADSRFAGLGATIVEAVPKA